MVGGGPKLESERKAFAVSEDQVERVSERIVLGDADKGVKVRSEPLPSASRTRLQKKASDLPGESTS